MKQILKDASKAYYDGKPFLTNEEYDALERIHGQIISGNGDVAHAYPMYSLNKHYGELQEAPVSVTKCVKTPKLDGAAVSVLYVDGELTHCLTRGDGKKGRNVTSKLAYLGVPECINRNGVVQIAGEVVAIKSVPNSRNFASGALNLKDMSEFYERVDEGMMLFVAYNVQSSNNWGITDSYISDMKLVESWGFHTIIADSYEEYPVDGEVYRIDNNPEFNSCGFTSKFPKGAFAHKENQEAVVTKLLDVVWQTGKSGKVTPVALLQPVVIGEAQVSRATLNNIAYIEALDLEIGCMVQVVRSGEIIPCIIGRADE